MDVARLIDLSLYSQFILIYLLIYSLKNSSLSKTSTRYFVMILISLFINNALELVSWILKGNNSAIIYYANYIDISILLALNALPAALWVRYIDYKIFDDSKAADRRLFYYLIPVYISTILIIINLFTGVVFSLTRENLYSRNFGLYIITSLSLIMVFSVFIISLRFKKYIMGQILESIFWFLLIPVTAGIIQIIVFGIPLIWPAFIFATLISFNLIEVETFLKDPLTLLNNRGQFEKLLSLRLTRKTNFSIIMIDVNGFKQINDTYGHEVGDEALKTIASILERSVKRYDNVYRYGGDEFTIIIESVKEGAAGMVIERLINEIDLYNQKKIKPYIISLSYGSVFYSQGQNKDAKKLLAIADQKMYENKIKIKSAGLTVIREKD